MNGLHGIHKKIGISEIQIYLLDIKTAKPNVGAFKAYKRTLLEWVATVLCGNPEADVHSIMAIPYNPYDPKSYDGWTMRGMLDLLERVKSCG